MNAELFELNFDFVGKAKAYNVSVLINPSRLEMLEQAESAQDVNRIIPFTVQEILWWESSKHHEKILKENDELTQTYSWVVSSLVGVIISQDSNMIQYFPQWQFAYKVNSLQKITLH